MEDVAMASDGVGVVAVVLLVLAVILVLLLVEIALRAVILPW